MLSFTPIVALFTQPWMLLWAVAAAAPILIHLLNRRRYREQTWAAMEYLLAAMRKNVRRIQIEQWLLLALRTLIVLLLVAAVADPVIQGLGLAHAAGARTHRLFVLDGSYSMGYRIDQAARFESAKQVITRIVDESPQGDGFTLVLMSAPPRVIVQTPSFARSEFLAELETLQLPHGGGDVAASLATANEVLRAARRDERKLSRDEVYIVSDLCGPSWNPADRGSRQAIHDRAATLVSEGTSLVVVDVGQDDQENIAVAELITPDRFSAVGRETRFEVQLLNHGRRDHSQVRVEFLVDGARVGAAQVDVKAGGTAATSFRHRFDSPGDHAVEARISGDKLDIDNHRWLSLPVRDRLRVLCVDGNPRSQGRPGATDYLRVALSPVDRASDNGLVDVVVATEGTWLENQLTGFDCVFLSDVRQFTAAEARLLESYLAAGGGLVTFLGPQVDAKNYNQRLCGQDGAPRVLPATIGELVAENQQPVDPLGYRHAIVSPFRDQEQAGLLTTPISHYFRLLPDTEHGAQVVAAIAGGDAWIVEAPVERGVSILVATSAADRDWTLLPVWPSFVPLVQEMLMASIQGKTEERNLLVGRPFGGNLGTAVADVPVRVTNPRDVESIVTTASDDGHARWAFGETYTSGVYRAAWNAPIATEARFAVNVDPREGELARLHESELRERIWQGVAFQYTADWHGSEDTPSVGLSRATPMHQGLLLAALLAMVAESTLAWYSGARAA
ncbi:MAG: VWA domain-containing protein [Planctomycetia bacterium]|nr:VWA domain-containing protein [Planctomycetia bacterium]